MEQNLRSQHSLAGVKKGAEMVRLTPVILIVEDELLLRMDSAEIIENAGFEVIQAADADEAIAILIAQPNIHVVFTDIQMPGSMDGLKLARFVRNRWPPIKIIATSGLARLEDDDLPAGSVFLPKPYRNTEVVAALRQLTGAA
jgi:CheY-like chemotaxis protein